MYIMRKLLNLLIKLICLGILFVSCEKQEGEGGSGSIMGKVFKILDDGAIQKSLDGTFSFVKDTIPACDEDIFIIYGENDYGYDDKVSTNHNGTFKFKYLNDGKYTIYTFSDLGSGEKVAEVREVEVVDEGSAIVEDIYIQDGKNIGYCGIVGQIKAMYEDADEPLSGVGLRVYLKTENGITIEDTRSDKDGYYSFAKLAPYTKYIVYAEHEPEKDMGIVAVTEEITTGAVGEIVKVENDLAVKIF